MKKFLRRLLFYLVIALVFFVAYLAYVWDDANAVSKGVPIPTYADTTAALLVIDIQEGTTGSVSKDDHYVDQSKTLITNVNRLIGFAYDAGIPVVYIQQQTENRLLNWLDGYALAIGHPGVALDSRLKIVSLNRFAKRQMDAFSNPELDIFLKNLQINRLVITGLDIARCANKTTLAAINRGYETIVAEDAVISEDEDLKAEKLDELSAAGAMVMGSAELQKIFDNESVAPGIGDGE